MKFFPFVILTLATVAAGCARIDDPTQYGATPAGPGSGLGGDIKGNDGLEQRPHTPNAFALFDPQNGYDPRAILTTIYFGFDRYAVADSERGKLASILDQAKNTRIIIAGYTDHFGTAQYNVGLSDRRARSVKSYLVNLGVPEGNIEIQAFGKHYARPAGNRDAVAEDRRAVVVNANFKP
ncbi:MAG: OmpA family protein [Puniceicoccales bacterium]|jgi:peptidoglycan-associated lipoprotein|nr:OmpA family protein [Puniceicoccales bacterium]